MLKIYLKLLATETIDNTGYTKGDTVEIWNDVFDKQNGIAYYSLSKSWKILKIEIVEFKNVSS